jgi:hypothetical protein
MAGMQDSLTIGIVLFLLIAALGVYVWLRFQQVETRLTLAESILLDMKMVAQAYSQFPTAPVEELPEHTAPASSHAFEMKSASYSSTPVMRSINNPVVNVTKFESSMIDTTNEMQPLTELLSTDNDFPSVLDEMKKEMEASESLANSSAAISSGDITIHQATSSFSGPDVNGEFDYNGMTLKDLRSLAKARGVGGTGSMNRGQLIAVLQERDTSANEPMQMEYETDVKNE